MLRGERSSTHPLYLSNHPPIYAQACPMDIFRKNEGAERPRTSPVYGGGPEGRRQTGNGQDNVLFIVGTLPAWGTVLPPGRFQFQRRGS